MRARPTAERDSASGDEVGEFRNVGYGRHTMVVQDCEARSGRELELQRSDFILVSVPLIELIACIFKQNLFRR